MRHIVALLSFVLLAGAGQAAAEEFTTINGKRYPRSEFKFNPGEPAFPEPHYHAANGVAATAADGTLCPDPAPLRQGFGLLKFSPGDSQGQAALTSDADLGRRIIREHTESLVALAGARVREAEATVAAGTLLGLYPGLRALGPAGAARAEMAAIKARSPEEQARDALRHTEREADAARERYEDARARERRIGEEVERVYDETERRLDEANERLDEAERTGEGVDEARREHERIYEEVTETREDAQRRWQEAKQEARDASEQWDEARGRVDAVEQELDDIRDAQQDFWDSLDNMDALQGGVPGPSAAVVQ